MNKNRNLTISFSNGCQCKGIMTVNFAISNVSKLYPDHNISVSIIETSPKDASQITLFIRENGNWKEITN